MPHRSAVLQEHEDDHTKIKFHLERPAKPYIEELALQLQRMDDGIPTACVYSYATELPNRFDPSHPPSSIAPNSRLAALLHKFYALRTSRECTVNLIDKDTGYRTRCPVMSNGFQGILQHQLSAHDRPCHYVCLVENCLAAFDKICNAKRHVTAIHSRRAAAKKITSDKRTKREMSHHVIAAQRKAALRKQRTENTGIARTLRRTPQISMPLPHKGPTSSLESYADEHENTRLGSLLLNVRSNITRTSTNGDVEITVTPKGYSGSDIERFRAEVLDQGEQQRGTSDKQMEWLAVTGLLQVRYWPSKVHYKFKTKR